MPVVKTFRTIERSDNWSVIFCHPVKLVYYIFPIGITTKEFLLLKTMENWVVRKLLCTKFPVQIFKKKLLTY